MKFKVLIIDDEKEMCASLSEILSSHGFDAIYTTDPFQVFSILEKNQIDLMIMDMKMPKITGVELLRSVKGKNKEIPIIMITGYPSIENAVKVMKYGALNFYVKPLNIKELIKEIKQLADAHQEKSLYSQDNILVTQNNEMQQILEEIKKVAPTHAPVLITGESGTGKELIASALHSESKREQKPFIKVNCSSIPDNLLESELFGHEKGSFTDAIKTRIGKFELANGGTIFLDEIGDMSFKTQPKLLRVLQDGEIQRIGSETTIQTNVRVVSATNRNVQDLINEQSFREDLYYRLSVVTFHLPPLRERKDDLIPLSNHFIQSFGAIYNKSINNISEEVKDLFIKHNWPGNIRELKNCLERAIIFTEREENELLVKHLPAQYRSTYTKEQETETLNDIYQHLSRGKILNLLAKYNGAKQKVADELKIHRKTLYNRMKKLGIE